MQTLKYLFKLLILIISGIVFLVSAIFLNLEGTTWGNSRGVIGLMMIIPAFCAMLKFQLSFFTRLTNSLVALVAISYTTYSYFESQSRIKESFFSENVYWAPNLYLQILVLILSSLLILTANNLWRKSYKAKMIT